MADENNYSKFALLVTILFAVTTIWTFLSPLYIGLYDDGWAKILIANGAAANIAFLFSILFAVSMMIDTVTPTKKTLVTVTFTIGIVLLICQIILVIALIFIEPENNW